MSQLHSVNDNLMPTVINNIDFVFKGILNFGSGMTALFASEILAIKHVRFTEKKLVKRIAKLKKNNQSSLQEEHALLSLRKAMKPRK
jgi:hypothetical protein